MRDIIVIGASAGGIAALKELTAGLPADFQASIFIVLHMLRDRPSILPAILAKESPLPVSFGGDREPIRPGHIYVASPNCHLLVEHNHLRSISGPREHFSRPAINPLFRSAAHAYRNRVIGIILTGQLDDGVAGLWEIKRQGGLAIVQDPTEAQYPSMPASAQENVEIDYTVNIAEMAKLLSRLVLEDRKIDAAKIEEEPSDNPIDITCPDCRGPLKERRFGKAIEYRCRVGHAHSPLSMMEPHRQAQERALWAALVALEEGAMLARQLADSTGAETYAKEAEEKAKHAQALKMLITCSSQDFI